MTSPMPIATMLELPDLVVSGCPGGIEIVLLGDLPEEDAAIVIAPPSTPVRNAPESN